jgi:multiple sugar transport system permease protein
MTVIDFLLFNGNAIFVTFVLIAMTIAFTLTVNPLAAYALSRFNLRGQDKILLFLLATMAFPAMISAIPAYLLMRDLGLLNTFWALVIPGAANGMSIFILKGFFDSLPMELFEAATIDGATEMQIFRIVAMPLVKPILAINCLTAFVIAYNGWQWALIICQDKEMWTIAVWLYQATTWWSGTPWIVSAGFVIASVPTFLVFVSCQKIILRGIVIPSMK